MADEKASAESNRIGFGLANARIAIVKRAKAVALVPALAAFAAGSYVVLVPERYTASALIQIDPRQAPAAAANPAATPAPAAFEAERRAIQKEIEVLRSPVLIDRVISELDLSHDPEFEQPPLLSRIASPFAKAAPETITREEIAARLAIRRIHNSLLIGVRFTSRDATKSARIANAFAVAYVAEQTPGAASSDAATTAASEPSASERVFASLLNQYGYTRTLTGARVVQQAQVPAQPAGPKRLRIVAATALSSLALMLALAVLLERNALLRARKVQKTLACPHMTSLPAMGPEEDTHMPARGARLIVAEPTCPYAEAIRAACETLSKRPSDNGGRVILVASALPGEGAELFASNMAHHLAVAGEKTLLVDCDFRSKVLTQQLAPHATAGLLDQIAAHTPIENVILRDSLTGVHFLPAAGPAPISIAVPAALRSVGFSQAFDGLKSRFPTIVLAAPPMLDATDARVLAELADQIVFLTAWHRTPHIVAKKALAMFGPHQHKVAGAVLTDIAADDDAGLMSFGAIFREIRRATRLSSLDRAA